MSYRIVNRHNLHTLNLAIKAEIHAADFIAIDTEFTGLGDPKLLKHQNMETRYTASVELVKTHALVALGVSIFKGSEVANYLFLLLSAVPHCINPQSITFLSQHGFDFNDQYENGIPYIPGNDFVAKRDDAKSIPKLMNPTNSLMRELIQLILCKTIVVHNGFLDLMFIYHSLYAKLPKSFPTFIADLDDICTQGIYDTKYISDYCVREPASFLELLYKKACRSNRDKTIEIKKLGTYTKEFTKIGLVELGLREQNFRRLESKSFYCEPYANHGYCESGTECSKSHDLDLILDALENKDAEHKAKKLKPNDPKTHLAPKNSPKTPTFDTEKDFEHRHTAAYDSFMTGRKS